MILIILHVYYLNQSLSMYVNRDVPKLSETGSLLLCIKPKDAAAIIFLFIYYLEAISFCLGEAVLGTKPRLRKTDKAIQKHLSKMPHQENLS